MKLSRSLVPDLLALQTFEAAARHGSFTRAAAELDLTQSAVSRQIRDLEAQLGVALFERVRQRVVLSDTGRRLQPDVKKLLGGVERLALRAASARDIEGYLTIATLPTFGSRWLMPRLPDFLAQHPGLQVTVITRSEPFDLAEAGVDVAIHYGQPIWPGATCDYLCRETVIPVAAANLGATPEDILGGAAALLHISSRPMLWPEWLEAQGADPSIGFRGHRFEQFSLLIEATLSGLGAALIPSYLIERELAQGRLTLLRDAPMHTDAGYYTVLPEGRTSDPVCRAFHDWITATIPKDRIS